MYQHFIVQYFSISYYYLIQRGNYLMIIIPYVSKYFKGSEAIFWVDRQKVKCYVNEVLLTANQSKCT